MSDQKDKVTLPVIGNPAPAPAAPIISSAASTVFCSAKIEGPGGHLWVDGNSKITASNGTYADPKPNAFSLEAQAVVNKEQPLDLQGWSHDHCPGSTAVCRSSCYVHGLEAAAKATYELYRHNSRTIREILKPDLDAELASEWAWNVANWITANASGGFRWHVSGDVYSRPYAAWIAAVISRSPDVGHWIYTRSFHEADPVANNAILEPLLDLPNLVLNLSCDRENYSSALAYKSLVEPRELATPLQLCYLTDDGAVPSDLPLGSVVFPDYALRGARNETPEAQRASSGWFQGLKPNQRKMVCPVDFYGKSEELRCGPCRKCLPR